MKKYVLKIVYLKSLDGKSSTWATRVYNRYQLLMFSIIAVIMRNK